MKRRKDSGKQSYDDAKFVEFLICIYSRCKRDEPGDILVYHWLGLISQKDGKR